MLRGKQCLLPRRLSPDLVTYLEANSWIQIARLGDLLFTQFSSETVNQALLFVIKAVHARHFIHTHEHRWHSLKWPASLATRGVP